MRVLVTGSSGFVGKHLVTELAQAGHEVLQTDLAKDGKAFSLDVTNKESVATVFGELDPDAVIHLAGLSHTQDSAKDLDSLFRVNVGGTANVCSALRTLGSQRKRSLLVVSSAFVYGGDQQLGRHVYNEQSTAVPRNQYGFSKLAAELAAQMYAAEDLSVYRVRPFNHIGPGQDSSFVVPGLARRIAACAPNGTIETGNLTAKRDFCDVRDVVRGYRLIIEKQPIERCFVLGAGFSVTIQSLLDELLSISSKSVLSKVSETHARANDAADLIADATLARTILGWHPRISLSQSLKDVWLEVCAQ